jgi:hypothetical protein
MDRISQLAITAFMWTLPLSLHAATVTLDPDSLTVNEGGTISVNLLLDATDAPGNDPGSYIGSVRVAFDEALTDFNGFSFAAPVLEGSPSVTDDGDSVVLGFVNAFGGPDTGVIGTFTFTALGAVGDVISFTATDYNPFGSFFNINPSAGPETALDPDFVNATVEVVPIPASLWLFSSALVFVGGIVRKRIALT